MERMVGTLSGAVGARDPYTTGHEKRVGELAVAIGRKVGLDADDLRLLRLAAVVHDLGKISVPAEILSKPTRLSEAEFAIIRGHSEAGWELLEPAGLPASVTDAVLQHHERLDGSGYPAGLRDDEIGEFARIIAVADVVEAMSSHRPYRPAIGSGAGTRGDRAGTRRAVRRARRRRVPAAVQGRGLRVQRVTGARTRSAPRATPTATGTSPRASPSTSSGKRPARGRRPAGVSAGRSSSSRQAEVVHAGLQHVRPGVHGPEPPDEPPARPGLEHDDLQQAVVQARHRRDVHAPAEGAPVADSHRVRVDRQLATLAFRVDAGADELDAPAGDDGPQRGLGVRQATAEERRGGRGVPVHEAADAGREHVEPIPLDRPAVEACEARPADVHGALRAASEGGEIRAELVRDAE